MMSLLPIEDNTYITNTTFMKIKQEYALEFQRLQKRKYLLLFAKNRKFLKEYQSLEKKKEEHNFQYLQKRILETDSLFANMNGYSLDYEQRMCILNEEDHLLVI